ncbi:uncharacterized protein LOC132756730 [Ruditapes philippinarum]|uniref:uncharacterized protein LOC132756730 n=1 Tax=Ruditapes philippinarum TaxID=129788 RepID=UPI00295BE26C|nr:uncharacterized protein LOC132756730 [Ruditapes philippinarum]
MSAYSEIDLSLVPEINFSFVELYIKQNKGSSGQKSLNKGFKYFCEGYIHDLRVQSGDYGCAIYGKCHRSQRKNEKPHQLKVVMKDCNEEISITYANCTCPIGVSGSCGHVTGTLYQIAKFKHLKQRVIPADAASTSLPQTWHAPRGQKIDGTTVDNLEVRGYSKAELRDIPGRSIQSTLYDPLRSDIKWNEHYEQLKREAPEMLMLDVIKHIPKMVPVV